MEKTTPPTLWVCYYRVSTQRQGISGLGLDAQRAAVGQFLRERGGTILAEVTETESGKKASNRPELQRALELCRKHRATLCIAKLDRLARNLAFIAGLLESNVEFVAADNPTKDRFMLHLQAAFAEEEGRRISLRTKEALAAAKRRGIVNRCYRGGSGAGLQGRCERESTGLLAHRAGNMGCRNYDPAGTARRIKPPGGAFAGRGAVAPAQHQPPAFASARPSAQQCQACYPVASGSPLAGVDEAKRYRELPRTTAQGNGHSSEWLTVRVVLEMVTRSA
jgi:hypothetical protein